MNEFNPIEKLKGFDPAKLMKEEDWAPTIREYGPAVRGMLRDILNAYMDMEEDDIEILTAWMMAAAFKDGFMTMPILYIHASRGSGKSRLLSLIEAVLPEALRVIDVTESAMFRLAGMQRCLIMDEAEKDKISNKDKVNLTELLNSCYKRGGSVVRVEKEKGRLVTAKYPVFVPVALANTFGLQSIIEDRSITVVLSKTKKQSIIRTPEYYQADPVIASVREWFSVCSVGFGGFLEHIYTQCMADSSLYNNKYKYIHNIHIPTLNSDVEGFLKKSVGLNVDGRNFELWTPLLEISYTVDPSWTDTLISIALRRIKDKVEDGAEFDRDTVIAMEFYRYLSNLPEPELYPKDFRDWYVEQQGMTESEKKKFWMSPEWVGHFLKRLRAVTGRKRLGKGYFYKISRSKVKAYLDARDALDEVDPTPAVVPAGIKAQSTVIRQSHIGDHPLIAYLKDHGGEANYQDFVQDNGPGSWDALEALERTGDVTKPRTGVVRLVHIEADDS